MSADGVFTFRGRNANEAMRKAVATLGNEVFLVSKRDVTAPKKGGLLQDLLGGEAMVEIVVSSTPPPAPAPPPAKGKTTLLGKVYGTAPARSSETDRIDLSDHARALRSTPAEDPPRRRRSLPAAVADEDAGMKDFLPEMEARVEKSLERSLASALGGMREEIHDEMRRLLCAQARGGLPAVSDGLAAAYERLVENDVAADVARDLVERLQREMPGPAGEDPEAIRAALCEAIARMIPTEPPVVLREGRPTVVALVGPTGVGKTTTLAKLAVEFAYRRGRRVAILNEDVRRPGAQEQLRNLSQLLSLPYAAADQPAEAAEAVASLRESDLILVDTAGRPPRSRAMEGLAAFLQEIRPDEIHLVVSSDVSCRAAGEVLERFRAVRYDRLVLSKLDEAVSYGLILNIAARVREGISYLTTGQEYMQRLRVGDGPGLARLVLGLERAEPDETTDYDLGTEA